MARRQKALLSAEFLAAHRHRLDAIGPWAIDADEDNLDVEWVAPAAPAGHWVPLGLRFHTDSGGLRSTRTTGCSSCGSCSGPGRPSWRASSGG